MDGAVVDDEKKPFDAEQQDDEGEDLQPDPDETLMLDQGHGRVWLVRIPKFLMQRWCAIDAEDVHLATIRVYDNQVNPSTGKTRIVLFLPPNKDQSKEPSTSASFPSSSQQSQPQSQAQSPARSSTPGTPSSQSQTQNHNRPVFDAATAYLSQGNGSEPDSYELEMVNDSVDNQYVVAERPKDAASSSLTASYYPSQPSQQQRFNPRARTTILAGRIKHECNLKPAFSARYRRQMKERHLKYNTRVRQIRMIEDAGVPGGRGGVNRLSSGVAAAGGGVGAGAGAFSELARAKLKPKADRAARMPRNQLLDQIFTIFRESPRWALRPLREKTQQPEVYLKEVLSEVAFLHRSGEFNGLWELKENFRDDNVRLEGASAAVGATGDVKKEVMEVDEDEDEDEDEDMEEVS